MGMDSFLRSSQTSDVPANKHLTLTDPAEVAAESIIHFSIFNNVERKTAILSLVSLWYDGTRACLKERF